jgi:hypothetical protein
MTNWRFLAAAAGVAAIVFGVAAWLNIDYLFFAGYVVLQYVVLASSWNILGGYTGYMNLGVSAFSHSAPTLRSRSKPRGSCRCPRPFRPPPSSRAWSA